MRRKIRLLLLGVILISKALEAQKISLQKRFQKEPEGYSRFLIEKKSKKTFLTAGYGVDGIGLFHTDIGFKIGKGLYAGPSIGYHPYQDGFHPGVVVHYNISNQKKVLEGHVRLLFDRLYNAGSEFEYLTKVGDKLFFGLMSEIEFGKEFMNWSYAKKNYVKDSPTYESNIMLGPISHIELGKKFDLEVATLLGHKKNHKFNFFNYKIIMGVSYHFK